MACVRRNRSLNWEPSFETSGDESVSTVANGYIPTTVSSEGSNYSEEFPAENTPAPQPHSRYNRRGLASLSQDSSAIEPRGKSYEGEVNVRSHQKANYDSCVELTDSTQDSGESFNCLRCQSYKRKIREASDYLVRQVLLERRSNHLLKSNGFHHAEDRNFDSGDARNVKKADRKVNSPKLENTGRDSGSAKSNRAAMSPVSVSSSDAGSKSKTPMKKAMASTGKKMAPARKRLTLARKETVQRKEMASTRKETIPARKKMTSARREMAFTRKETLPVKKRLVQTSKETSLTWKETIPAKKESVRKEVAPKPGAQKSSVNQKQYQSIKNKAHIPRLSNASLRNTKWTQGKSTKDNAHSAKTTPRRLKVSAKKSSNGRIPLALQRMENLGRTKDVDVSRRNRPITRSRSKLAALKRGRPKKTAIKSKHFTKALHSKKKQGEVPKTASSNVQEASKPPSLMVKQQNPSTVKYDQFTRDVMSMSQGLGWVSKPVEKVPGVGLLNMSVLKKNSISTAKCLYGHYLIKGRQFKKYLESIGIDRLSARKIHLSLKTWDEYHN